MMEVIVEEFIKVSNYKIFLRESVIKNQFLD